MLFFLSRNFCSSELSYILLPFRYVLGIIFSSLSGFFPAMYRICVEGFQGKKKKKKLIWAILLAGATLLMLSEWRFLPSNVLFLSFCTYNLCPKGCHNDILIISWRVVTVKFNVALEPTV